VLIGSPDHWHALHAIAAIESGAEVYCQKPISRDVPEGESMLDAARKHNRLVQIGTQRKSTPHLIDAKKQVIEAGHISTASCILANFAIEIGRPVVYDPKRRVVVGDSEATKVLRRPYRASWKHPGVA
jgi:predicted dehydrogenase